MNPAGLFVIMARVRQPYSW